MWHTSHDSYCPKFSAHILEPLFLQCTGDKLYTIFESFLLTAFVTTCFDPKIDIQFCKSYGKKKGQWSWQTLSDWVKLGRPGKYWHKAM